MRLSIFAFGLVMATGLSNMPVQAQDHAAHHPAPPAVVVVNAQRWAADETLHQHMRGVRAAVEALDHYERGHMGPEQAIVIVTQMERHVDEIIAQCKLAPDADAALHAILAPLMTGAASLKSDPKRIDVIPSMREAMAQYERQFDYAGAIEDASVQH